MEILGNRYQIIRKIGGGGMAIVYLAKDVFLDRLVAVKVLREEYVGDQDFIRRFHKEAKAVASLNDQNIVNIYDYGTNNEQSFLVMEYVEGKTLKEYILNRTCLSVEQAAEIGRQICSGIAKAHSKNIVHKDIKPQNILIDKDSIVKVTDFGIAQAGGHGTITHNKEILGSAHYFSPEQARGETVTYQTDIYSIGVVLYEMVTGKLPFTGDNPVSVALKHIQAEIVPPSKINPEVSYEMEKIIMKAMAKSPLDRYDTVADMQKDLAYLANGSDFIKIDYFPEIVEKNDRDETILLSAVEEDEKDGKQDKKKAPIRIHKKALAIILGVIVLLLFGVFHILNHAHDVTVPPVVGEGVLEAQKILINNDLSMEITDSVYDKEIEEGRIIRQEPKANSRVKSGREIKVIVSLGPEKIVVPDLSGMTVREAEVCLENYGLILGKTTTGYSAEYKKDTIIFQSPKARTELTEETAIDVILSLGQEPEQIIMPNLVGDSLTIARQKIAENHLLEGELSYEETGNYAPGVVIRQSTAANTQVLQGSVINLVISKEESVKNTSATEISFVIPSSGSIILELTDDNGVKTVYSGNGEQGENFIQEISYQAQNAQAKLDIYCCDILVDSRILP